MEVSVGVIVLLILAVVICWWMYQNCGCASASMQSASSFAQRSKMQDDLRQISRQRSGLNEIDPVPADPSSYDYNDYVTTTGLEQSVVDSHRQFVNDIQQATSGASTETILSGDVDVNPWIGLRRPDYQSVFVDPSARNVPTEEQDQMPPLNKYYTCSGGLF